MAMKKSTQVPLIAVWKGFTKIDLKMDVSISSFLELEKKSNNFQMLKAIF